MTTAVQDRIDRAVIAATKAWEAHDKTILPLVIEQILREQDKDTRHACAEAVMTLTNPFIIPCATAGDCCKEHGFAIAQQAAHQACINAIPV